MTSLRMDKSLCCRSIDNNNWLKLHRLNTLLTFTGVCVYECVVSVMMMMMVMVWTVFVLLSWSERRFEVAAPASQEHQSAARVLRALRG